MVAPRLVPVATSNASAAVSFSKDTFPSSVHINPEPHPPSSNRSSPLLSTPEGEPIGADAQTQARRRLGLESVPSPPREPKLAHEQSPPPPPQAGELKEWQRQL